MLFSERFWRWMAWKLPRDLVYWAVTRMAVSTTPDNDSPSSMKIIDSMERWRKNVS